MNSSEVLQLIAKAKFNDHLEAVVDGWTIRFQGGYIYLNKGTKKCQFYISEMILFDGED